MNYGYSIRLDAATKQALKNWAAEYDQRPAWLIKRILSVALQQRRAESTQSGSPASDLLNLPKIAIPPAFQAESEN